jgi:hypothetical protein
VRKQAAPSPRSIAGSPMATPAISIRRSTIEPERVETQHLSHFALVAVCQKGRAGHSGYAFLREVLRPICRSAWACKLAQSA